MDSAAIRSTSSTTAMTRLIFAPVLLVGFGGAVIAVAASGASHLWIVTVVLGAIAASTVAERLAPYEPEWNDDRGDRRRDRLHALVNETSSALGVVALPTLTGVVAVFDSWPSSLPFPVQVLLAVVVLDAGITLTHWASHRVGMLWRFHSVHHSVTRTYGLNGLMKHPIHQLIETAGGIAPLLLLNLPRSVGAAAAGLVVIQLLAQHSNVDYRVGAIGRFLALNQGHRLHHVNRAGEGDVNFGLFTLIWDRLLGTYRDPRTYAVRDGELGIAGRSNFPTAYFDQLVEPFLSRAQFN